MRKLRIKQIRLLPLYKNQPKGFRMKVSPRAVEIIEGNLREVPTEDGLGYYPDLQIIATVGNLTYIHPHLFQGDTDAFRDATDLMERVVASGMIDLDIWVEVQDNYFSYSKGNDEPYDSEEEYYMGVA